MQQREADMDVFFKHENNPTPPALSDGGKLRSGTKSDLMYCLVDTVAEPPTLFDVKVLDGAAVVHMLSVNAVGTFIEYANSVFLPHVVKQLENCQRIDVVWDTYLPNSIKESTREKRGKGVRRKVLGKNKIPGNWNAFLCDPTNEQELFSFLSDIIATAELPSGKVVAITCGEKVEMNGGVHLMETCDHEEADTRILIHLQDALQHGATTCLVRTVDTDVIVILIGKFYYLLTICPSAEIWVAFGTGKDFRYININAVAQALGIEISTSLPIFHSFTGCDTVSSFYGRGKKTAWQAWKAYKEVTEAFVYIASNPFEMLDVTSRHFEQLERYCIILYDKTSSLTSMNDTRKELSSIPEQKKTEKTEDNNLEEQDCNMDEDVMDSEEEIRELIGDKDVPKDAEQNYSLKNGLWYKKDFTCSHCSFATAWPSEFRKHGQLHVSEKKIVSDSPELKSFTCHLCNTVLENQLKLNIHMNTVHKVAAKTKNLLNVLQKIQKPTNDSSEAENNGADKGSVVSDRAADKAEDTANSHLIGGTVKEPFCKVCGYKAKWVSELEKHIRVHTQEKPYPCRYCSHSARWKGDLTRHIQKIHPSKLDEFYELSGVHRRKAKPPKPHPVQIGANGANRMVFPGMQQPDSDESESEKSDTEDLHSEKETQPPEPPKTTVDEQNNVKVGVELDDNSMMEAEEELDENNLQIAIENPNDDENTATVIPPAEPLQVTVDTKALGNGMSVLKKVKKYIYKCLSCDFSSKTPSRFHVHIVQHLNKRPYMCSECNYRSNWEWDITKHIKIKSQKMEGHTEAKVLLIDEAGRKNYEKYNKYRIEIEEEVAVDQIPRSDGSASRQINSNLSFLNKRALSSQTKITYKCKSCHRPESSKRAVITHIISHLSQHIIEGCGIVSRSLLDNIGEMTKLYTVKSENDEDFFACEVCPYESRKQVNINLHIDQHRQKVGANYKCHFCPYWVSNRKTLLKHLKLHVFDPNLYLREVESLLVVETETNLIKSEERKLIDPSIPNVSVVPTSQLAVPISQKSKINLMAPPPSFVSVTAINHDSQRKSIPDKKKFFCDHCPYESDNRTQFLYHKQFHRTIRPNAHKCRFCSYSVSRLHLLRQHQKVHALNDASSDSDFSERNISTSENHDPGSSVKIAAIASTESKNPRYNDNIPSLMMKQGEELIKVFKCRYCPLVNRRRANVRVHEQMHTKDSHSKFVCPMCNYQCNNQGVLTAHIKIHQSNVNEVDPYTYSVSEKNVPKISATEQSSISSMKQPSNVPPHLLVSMPMPRPKYRAQNFRCGKCTGIFKTQNDLDNHLKFHGINLPFRCHFCDYAARCKPHLHNHLRVHSEGHVTKFTGEPDNLDRDKSFDISGSFSPQSTSSPSVTITPMPPRKPANVNFNNNNNFSPEHNALLKEETCACDAQLQGQPGNIACKLCPAKFKELLLLQFHNSLHGSVGQYRCSRCSYAVSELKNITSHSKLHPSVPSASPYQVSTSLRPFRCQKCPAMFNKLVRFERHVSLHGTMNRYICDQCDYSVKFAANLIKHKKVHHQNVTATHRVYDNGQVTISPITSESVETRKSNSVMLQASSTKYVSGRIPPKPNTPLQQQLQNKEWLQESVNHVIAEDLDSKTRIFRCDRCPYVHNRKDAVQNHLRRHIASQGLGCKYCDYRTRHMCFLKDHVKCHFSQGQWLKVHNYAKIEDMEITAVSVSTGEKKVVFCHNKSGVGGAKFEPEICEDETEESETRMDAEHVVVKEEPMDVNESYNDQEYVPNCYSESSLQKYNGMSMVPNTAYNEPPEVPDVSVKISKMAHDKCNTDHVSVGDYALAMQNVENLGFEDVFGAIDKFMNHEYVPVKETDPQ
ncbi:Zinc finger protein 91 [Nymphon striatum]|nr:Zinc finger protein 91 [Nymphon striatum]